MGPSSFKVIMMELIQLAKDAVRFNPSQANVICDDNGLYLPHYPALVSA